jgi:hypothetical protein
VKNVVDLKVVQEAKNSLSKYLPEGEYKNKVFIDVGWDLVFSRCQQFY